MDMAPVIATAGAALGILFVYSGVAKARVINKFATDLLLLPYLPHRFARSGAVIIPIVEIVAGAFAVVGHVWAQATILALLTLFSVFAVGARATNQKIPCNCFGSQDYEYLSLGTVLRNVGLGAIALMCIFAETESATLLSWVHGFILFLLFLTVTAVARNERSDSLRGNTI